MQGCKADGEPVVLATATLDLPEEFSAPRALAFLERSSLGTPYRFRPDGARRAVLLDGRPYGLDFRFDGSLLHVTLAAPAGETTFGHAWGRRARELARHLWGLDVDPGCLRKLREDPRLAPVLAAHRGLTVLRAADLYEALLIVIIGQQVSVASASAVRRRLQAALGEPFSWDDQVFFTAPRPQRLEEAGMEGLRVLGFSRQKARYVLEVARRAREGELDPARFAGMDDEEAIQHLTAIPGVGRWTAENVLIRGLGRHDVIPAGDLGIRVAVQRLLGLAERPGEAEVRKLAAAWAGCRSYATLYLWATLSGS